MAGRDALQNVTLIERGGYDLVGMVCSCSKSSELQEPYGNGHPLNWRTCSRSLAASHRIVISLSEGSLIARETDDVLM